MERPIVLIKDVSNRTNYILGKFLGKGSFSRCYQLKCELTGQLYAGKMISKEVFITCKERTNQEIGIHKHLKHENIIKLINYFSDSRFVYIVLEVCPNQSMAELIVRRKSITEFEARYYMRQIVLAVAYLHGNNIVHRDLKLGNLLLNNDMVIKVADFGLATLIHSSNKRKTFCGTPNYIAPEMLLHNGHSFEVDIWALGCILYTLLVGVPPFQSVNLKATYKNIAACDYDIPEHIKGPTLVFITKTLQQEPGLRPQVGDLLNEEFFTCCDGPKRLPQSCLLMPPRFVIQEINIIDTMYSSLAKLKLLVDKAINSSQLYSNTTVSDAINPTLQPVMWISSWMDYSNKFGFGYRLNDESIGILFNDNSTMVLLSSSTTVYYIHVDMTQKYFEIDQVDTSLEIKLSVLMQIQYFIHSWLTRAGSIHDEVEKLTCIPVVVHWARYENTTVMILSNGTLQINLLHDHTKIILCPVMEAVTTITIENEMTTYQLTLLEKYGSSTRLNNILQICLHKIEKLLSSESIKMSLTG